MVSNLLDEYAKSILSELGDLQVRVSSDKNHLGVTMHFNPINAASGEYDMVLCQDLVQVKTRNFSPF